ncbi:FAD:protein FMN transferase [Streptomyces neyagawaensis]|uniref:FAD:protein FMN transferase n=1 Tax=Streptomyces neyagawaensis TaxID=42238 RepID=UPI00201D15CF|nr:FAD:protein FMN transferase [Streptomyces neyagawaensis]MCL6735143.1 FAD:protein FMN transferase [Streptomyces neyagawaensis]MDE1687538.1 FAD:protein FMN transferase [Streptomyces neyagawaensis]
MTTRTPAPSPSRTVFPALGTTAALLVTDPAALPAAEATLRAELAAVDRACSRFRADSELTRVNASAGVTTAVGEYFADALQAALHAARLTDGAVDPTVGGALTALGYDRTFVSLLPEDARPVPVARPAPGWRRIAFDPHTRMLRLPPGTRLDLGATAKALSADRAARQAAAVTGCGVLVGLGGDLATAGPAPEGGWRIAVADDHARPAPEGGAAVAVTGGALATSGIRVRTWRRGGRILHHIVDPVSGEPAASVWRTVTVAAATCVDANAVSTAAIVLGDRAVDWLRGTGLPIRLAGVDGTVVRLGGWPPDVHAPAPAGLGTTAPGGPR